MNDSGTNSVKPPVRSCSSRTTRMCSASSQGSSMWPNITVTVERIPSAWQASMISTQRATGSLLGEIRSRTPSCSTSAAVPGVEPSPASRRRSNTRRGDRPLTSHMCATSIGEYACRCSCGASCLANRNHFSYSSRPQSGWIPDCMQISVAPASTASCTRRANSSSECTYASGERRACPNPQNAQPTMQMFETLMLRLTTNVTVSPASSDRSSSAAARISSITAGRCSANSAVSSSGVSAAPSRARAIARGAASSATRQLGAAARAATRDERPVAAS